jgi:hypothetical protein
VEGASWQDRRREPAIGADAAFLAIDLLGGLTIVIDPSPP